MDLLKLGGIILMEQMQALKFRFLDLLVFIEYIILNRICLLLGKLRKFSIYGLIVLNDRF